LIPQNKIERPGVIRSGSVLPRAAIKSAGVGRVGGLGVTFEGIRYGVDYRPMLAKACLRAASNSSPGFQVGMVSACAMSQADSITN
jgi:hypothetical protein